ncbi:MAG: hypothetical protein WDN06_07920 [Asticcacaulis sp.]
MVEKTYESLDRVNRLLSDHNIKTFSDSLDNLQAITADLKSRQQLLDDAHEAIISAGQAADAVTQLAHSTNGVVSDQMPETMQKIDAATDKLAAAADHVSELTVAIQAPVRPGAEDHPARGAGIVAKSQRGVAIAQIAGRPGAVEPDRPDRQGARQGRKVNREDLHNRRRHRGSPDLKRLRQHRTQAEAGADVPFRLCPPKCSTRRRPSAPATGMPPAGIVFGTITFPQDSSGDRVTTLEGNEVSYVSQARWTAPAQELFNENGQRRLCPAGIERTAGSTRTFGGRLPSRHHRAPVLKASIRTTSRPFRWLSTPVSSASTTRSSSANNSSTPMCRSATTTCR